MLELIQLLVEVESAPLDDVHQATGLTALMCAAVRGHESVVAALCDAKADVSVVNTKDGGRDALMMAAMNGHLEVVTVLLGAGADADRGDETGMRAAHWALCMEHEDVGEAILEANGGHLVPDNEGMTPQVLLDNLRADNAELNPQEADATLHEPHGDSSPAGTSQAAPEAVVKGTAPPDPDDVSLMGVATVGSVRAGLMTALFNIKAENAAEEANSHMGEGGLDGERPNQGMTVQDAGLSGHTQHTVEPSEDTMVVGSIVSLISDRAEFQMALEKAGLQWDDAMEGLLGATQEVVDLHAIETDIFGLPASDPKSKEAVWWYSFGVVGAVVSVGHAEAGLNEDPDPVAS